MTSRTSEPIGRSADEAEPALHVVATAGHVDHGKSSLILRLTGMDPDRLAEEKRRGLTIDLGYAWCRLSSGREIGFVDVPGHERFVRNMLAGVGPVRLVLFVVAADEGWKPQSEEHLAILDVLGTASGVVALTKRDLVDADTLALAEQETRERLAGTALERAPIVACSSATGEGLDELGRELDDMIGAAPAPEQHGRPRHHVDRIFTIKGAGTVVTGTLIGGRLELGQEVELYPTGARARIRGLQTHKRDINVARPVSRVAVNLVGIDRGRVDRGDVLGLPGQWRPTRLFDARIRPVRELGHALTGRGAYKLHAGSAERDARIRLFGTSRLLRGQEAFVRVRLSRPLVLANLDRFVLREAGRRETVAGGLVLDPEPPARGGPSPGERLARLSEAAPEELPALLIEERGAVRARDLAVLTGAPPRGVADAVRAGAWWVSPRLHAAVVSSGTETLARFHKQHPLRQGLDLAELRAAVAGVLERARAAADPGLVDALIEDLEAGGLISRAGRVVRLSSHRVTLAGREEELARLVKTVSEGEPRPPTIDELVVSGFSREVIEAATSSGELVRISPELVMTPAFVQRAEATIRGSGPAKITVSEFRERMGTTRKFALPLLEHFDRLGVTRREGDARVLRESR